VRAAVFDENQQEERRWGVSTKDGGMKDWMRTRQRKARQGLGDETTLKIMGTKAKMTLQRRKKGETKPLLRVWREAGSKKENDQGGPGVTEKGEQRGKKRMTTRKNERKITMAMRSQTRGGTKWSRKKQKKQQKMRSRGTKVTGPLETNEWSEKQGVTKRMQEQMPDQKTKQASKKTKTHEQEKQMDEMKKHGEKMPQTKKLQQQIKEKWTK